MGGQDHIAAEPVNAPIFPAPPIAALLFMATGWALNHFVPIAGRAAALPLESLLGGAAIMVCAVAIALFAVRTMMRAKTSFVPGAKAGALVATGVYKRTRNPMYLSLTLFTLGLGIATANLWMVLLAPVLLLYLQERVVKREEAYLSRRFGAEYDDYKAKVRRWF